MERITRANVEERCANVNRRMESRGSIVRYEVEGRNGYTALDRCHVEYDATRVPDRRLITMSTVTVGTKREVADFLHAMMVALDDAAVVS